MHCNFLIVEVRVSNFFMEVIEFLIVYSTFFLHIGHLDMIVDLSKPFYACSSSKDAFLHKLLKVYFDYEVCLFGSN